MIILRLLKKALQEKFKKRSKAKIIRSVWFNKETEPEKQYITCLHYITVDSYLSKHIFSSKTLV